MVSSGELIEHVRGELGDDGDPGCHGTRRTRKVDDEHARIDDARDAIGAAIREAFHIASTGRPGPVLIDVPMDIFSAEVDIARFERLRHNTRTLTRPTIDRETATRIVRVPGLSMFAAALRLSACRRATVDSSMGPSCAQRSRSGVAMTASGFFDLNELPPGLPRPALESLCAAAPNSRACMDLRTSRSIWFSPWSFRPGGSSPGQGPPGPSPGDDSEGQY